MRNANKLHLWIEYRVWLRIWRTTTEVKNPKPYYNNRREYINFSNDIHVIKMRNNQVTCAKKLKQKYLRSEWRSVQILTVKWNGSLILK